MNAQRSDVPSIPGKTGRRRAIGAVATAATSLAALFGVATAPPAGAAACDAVLGAGGGALGFGRNNVGQVGDGTFTERRTPVDVLDLGPGSGVVEVASGGHSLARTSDGALYSWGRNDFGQLGRNGTETSEVPAVVPGFGPGSDIIDVSVGLAHTLALRGDGAVFAWGLNSNGQLGNDSTLSSGTPVPVSGLGAGSDVESVSAGALSSFALKGDGSVVSWGYNSNGQLGDTTTVDKHTPVPVAGLAATLVTQISAGASHTLAVRSNGSAIAWGWGNSGRIGDGATADRTSPVTVIAAAVSPNDVTAVAAGGSHSLALKGTGAVSGWGVNASGQVGDASTTQRNSPVAVAGLGATTVASIAAGGLHSLAVKADGSTIAWGEGGNGRLGDNATTDRTSPVAVGTLASGVTAVTAGDEHSLAIRTGASVAACAGATQAVTVGQAFAPLKAVVRDAANATQAGVTVTFTAPATGATGTFPTGATATAVTDANGVATAPTFTANTTAGAYAVTPSADTYAVGPLFRLTNAAGPPAALAAIAGTPQAILIGTQFPVDLQARVKDASDNLVSGATVTFTAPASGASGTFTGGDRTTTAMTNAAGVATARFTANTTAGTYSVVASAAGTASTAVFALTNSVTPVIAPARTGKGYELVASDGGVFAFGDARFHGSAGGSKLNRPIVGMANTPSNKGYWLVASDGGIFAYGDATFLGSTGAMTLNRPIVGMASTPTGGGYWLVASDGGIFSFGDATFLGSTGAMTLNRPIVGMATTPTGKGYWLVASDGGIFAYGDATFFGSTGALTLNRPIVGMSATATGKGYWLVATDGGIFSYGDATFLGSTGATVLNKPIVGMASRPTSKGYWLVATDGGIFSYGDATFLGSTGSAKLNVPIVGMAAT